MFSFASHLTSLILGKIVDTTIVGSVEVVTAIVAASMPILRVLYTKGFSLCKKSSISPDTSSNYPVTIGSDDKRLNASYLEKDQGGLLLSAANTDVESRASSQGDKEPQFLTVPVNMRV